MTRSFTLIELLVVIIIIGIIVSTLSFNFSPNQLDLAADQIIKDIRLTQSLALKDDKYQPFPNHICDNSNIGKIECNRSKYWFKQWWQIKFTNSGRNIIYYIFSDKPDVNSSNFNKKIIATQYEQELAKINNIYKIGTDKNESGNNNYPNSNNVDFYMNLTKKFGIIRIEYSGYYSSSMSNNMGRRISLLFDNEGNIYQKEGLYANSSQGGDKGDINPLDKTNRKLLTQPAKIKLCNKLNSSNNCLTDKKHCIAIEITPTGSLEKTTCN